MKLALITGITGQDGSYLAELLLDSGYKVYGMLRRSSSLSTLRIDHIFSHPNFVYAYGDMTDMGSLMTILREIRNQAVGSPTFEIYNLSAQSHVKVSFDNPIYTGQVDAIGTLNLLEAVRQLDLIGSVKIYQASTSELYGDVVESPQNERTPFNPQSPYAIAKQYGFWITKNYREAYSMFICNGILFNHTSPRRGHTFVCRKIVLGIANISKGKQQSISLGNLNARRDWGHAKDYVEAMVMILSQDKPDDYVIASGETYSIRELVELCFEYISMRITWSGQGLDEIGVDENGIIRVKVDAKYFRPTEVNLLIGDPTKARTKLGWSPKHTLRDIIAEMMERDLANDSLY